MRQAANETVVSDTVCTVARIDEIIGREEVIPSYEMDGDGSFILPGGKRCYDRALLLRTTVTGFVPASEQAALDHRGDDSSRVKPGFRAG